MNLLELDSTAEGMFTYLRQQTDNPLDSVAILGITLLKIFDRATDGTLSLPVFAEDFKQSLIASYAAKTDSGTETRQ